MHEDTTFIDAPVHGDEEHAKIITPDKELPELLYRDLMNQKSSNTSFDLDNEMKNSNRVFVSDQDWFQLGKSFMRPKQIYDIKKSKLMNSFLAIQKWEGIVEKIDDSTFWARLIDQSSGKEKKGWIQFDIDEVDPGDTELIDIGALFYWSIGYQYNRGVRTKSSLVRFSRLPNWSAEQVQRFKSVAAERFSKIKKL